MDVNFPASNMIRPLTVALGAVDIRSPNVALQKTLLKIRDGRFYCIGSDASWLARATADVEIVEDGEALIDGKRLLDLLRAAPPDQKVRLRLSTDQSITIHTGRSKFKLETLDATLYPRVLPNNENRVSLNIGGKRLAEMLDQVLAAMAKDDLRYYLNGVLIRVTQNALWFVATDGYRLAVAHETVDVGELPDALDTILPRRAITHARTMLNGGGSVTLIIGPSDTRIEFSSGDVLWSKSVGGQFPDWERAVPKNQYAVQVDRAKLRQEIAMMTAIAEKREHKGTNGNWISLIFGEGVLGLKQGDNASSEIDCDVNSALTDAITFNMHYLADAILSLPASENRVRIGYEGVGQPITVTPAGDEYPITVLMPIRE